MKSVILHMTGEECPVGKILCLGRNYADHAKEMSSEIPKSPVLFLKPPSALIRDGEPIVLTSISSDLHHEVELVVVIGKDGKGISATRAFDHVLGYGVGLDMTLRDVQSEAKKRGLPWSVAKGFDTSAPVSRIIAREKIPNVRDLTIRCSVNGTVRQHASTAEMIFSVEQIIEYISSIFTLERGDLIFTGTPGGVGSVKAGDVINAELVGLTNTSHRVISD